MLAWISVPPYDAILFDFDGVLVDTEPLHFECWKQILATVHIPLDWPTYQANCIGIADRALLDFFASLPRGSEEPILSRDREGAVVSAPNALTEADWQAKYGEKKRMYSRELARRSLFTPEIVDLIHSLNGYRLAIVSSSPLRDVEAPLEAAGLRHRFHALVCGDQVYNLKPDPEPYLRAANLLASQSPLVVEDSDAGVSSATAAGFDFVRVRHSSETPDALRRALK